jgi:SAM-dependent MidA family methyltransferase
MASAGKKIRLVELGPGRGTLMDDMLRVGVNLSFWSTYKKLMIETLFAFPAVSNHISSIVLVENSEHLRKVQGEKLDERIRGKQVDLSWVDKIDDIPECTYLSHVGNDRKLTFKPRRCLRSSWLTNSLMPCLLTYSR